MARLMVDFDKPVSFAAWLMDQLIFTDEAAIAGVPFREAYKAAAQSADTAGQGRTPEGSLAARTSPGGAADLRLDTLRARWNALA